MLSRPRVLISAFACNPEMGSEPGLGFRYVRALAPHCDLTVVTEEMQNRSAIERQMKSDPILTSVRFHFIPWPRLTRAGEMDDHINFVSYYRAYNRWQRDALAWAREAVQAGQFDVVHHLTMTGFREPGYLWTLGIPFVWGPVGGHVMMPIRFMRSLGLRGAVQCLIRNVLNWIQMRLSMRVAFARHAARTVFASTSVDLVALRKQGVGNVVLLGENASQGPKRREPRCRDQSQPLKLVWSGLHIPRKALPIALNALARCPADRAELHVLGMGPETVRWKKIANRLGVQERCHFHGWLRRDRAIELVRGMDALVLTSVQDATTAALFEALEEGLPVVAHRACGFQDILTSDCALLVPLQSPDVSCSGFADAILQLANDPDLYNRLSSGALHRTAECTWEKRAAAVLRAYRGVVESTEITG